MYETYNADVRNSGGHTKGVKRAVRDEAPTAGEALQQHCPYPTVDVDYPTAIAYLRREAIVLPPESPRGYVAVSFRGHRLGFVKNIGSRANNLYPKAWAIKSTYIPSEYETILKLA